MRKLAFIALLAFVMLAVMVLNSSDNHVLKISFAFVAAYAIARTRRWAKRA